MAYKLCMQALTLCVSLFITTKAFSDTVTETLRLTGIPPINGIFCDDHALQEGERLKNFVGTFVGNFNVTDSRCESIDEVGDDQGQWNIAVTYTADAALPVVSTYRAIATATPGFASFDACKLALKQEEELFKRTTKLNLFTSYCRIPLFRDQQYEITIVAFGEPAVAPYTSSTNIFGAIINHTEESFFALVKSGLSAVSAELAQISMINRASVRTLALRYYSANEIMLENSKLAAFPTNDLCVAQVEAAKLSLKDAGVFNIATFCQRTMFNGNIAELRTLTDEHKGLFFANPGTSYDTYELCEAAIPAIINHYKTALRRDIKSGYCSLKNDLKVFEIVMIEKR